MQGRAIPVGTAIPVGRAFTNDVDGVLVGPDGAIGAESVDDRAEVVVRLGAEGLVDLQGAVAEVVVDADREMVARLRLAQFIEHGLHHRRGELLGGQPEAPTDQPRRGCRRRGSSRPGLLHRVHQIEVERFAAAARFLAAVENGDRPHAGRQGGHQALGAEGPKQPHLEHPHPLTSGAEGIHRFMGGFTARSHQHHHPLGGGIAVVIEQVVGAAGEGGEGVHRLLHQLRGGGVEAVHRFPRLERHILVLAGAPDHRLIGAEAAAPMGLQQRLRDQGPQVVIGDQLDRLDFVGGAEAIEEMQKGQARAQRGQAGDGGKIAGLLHRSRAEQGAAAAAGSHHIAVVAEDRQRARGEGAGGHMDHRGGEFTGDLVEVGDHQQQPLRRREGGGQRPRLQGTVHHTRHTGFALHLHHGRHRAPEVGPSGRRPAVGPFAHRRGGGDRVDRHHLVEPVGDPGHRLVAIQAGAAHRPTPAVS